MVTLQFFPLMLALVANDPSKMTKNDFKTVPLWKGLQ